MGKIQGAMLITPSSPNRIVQDSDESINIIDEYQGSYQRSTHLCMGVCFEGTISAGGGGGGGVRENKRDITILGSPLF